MTTPSRLNALVATVLTIVWTTCRSPPTDVSRFSFVENASSAETLFGEDAERVGPGARWDIFTLGGETRRALSNPPGLRLTFEVELPDEPVLWLAIAASTMGRPTLAAPVTFRLLADGGHGDELVFEERVRRSRPNRWFPRKIDLSPWAGKEIRLRFEVASPAGNSVLPLWGNPVLLDRSRRPSRPNIILISVDCLRVDHLGVYGYERDTSPNIDALAKDSVLFRTAISTSSYTLPTHASMLTGLPPSLHGATLRRRISAEAAYAPELLADAGYRVNGLVSAPFLSQTYGFDRGFHTYRLRSGRARELVDDALALLREGQGQSQFLFLHLFDAHWPYSPPGELLTRFGPRPTDISSLLGRVASRAPPEGAAEVERIVRLYDAEITYLDRELGRFFEELRKSGIYEHSLLILTADHGEAFYEHGDWEHARPWRREGPGLYGEILRVPLIVKWPGVTGPMRIDDVVSQVDIFPTILQAAGIPRTTSWARDLMSYVEAGNGSSGHRTVLAEFVSRRKDGGTGVQIALRDDRYKYIAEFRGSSVDNAYPGTLEKEQLFDLARDPRETLNLLESSAPGLGAFRAELRSYVGRVQQGGSGSAEVAPDEELLEELGALGYIEN